MIFLVLGFLLHRRDNGSVEACEARALSSRYWGGREIIDHDSRETERIRECVFSGRRQKEKLKG
jgi:hypothetical protein